MTLPSTLDGSVLEMRPFLPAKDFQKSLHFYEDLGFRTQLLGDKFASMHLGSNAFLLQELLPTAMGRQFHDACHGARRAGVVGPYQIPKSFGEIRRSVAKSTQG